MPWSNGRIASPAEAGLAFAHQGHANVVNGSEFLQTWLAHLVSRVSAPQTVLAMSNAVSIAGEPLRSRQLRYYVSGSLFVNDTHSRPYGVRRR